MAREIKLEQESPVKYKLRPILYPHEQHQGEYPVSIYCFGPVEGHFLVKLMQPQDDTAVEAIVGIAHSEAELPDKVYRCALEAGREYAKKLECRFVDETPRSKEGELTGNLTK